MIDGFAQEGQLVNAESLVAQLKLQGHRPDHFTFRCGRRVGVRSSTRGNGSSNASRSAPHYVDGGHVTHTIITSYSPTPAPDVLTRSSLLRAAVVAFAPRRALSYYRMMRNEGVVRSGRYRALHSLQ